MITLRTPEPFWRETGPKTPWGPFDPDAKLHFSFDLSPWIVSAGTALTLASCEVIADPLLAVEKAVAGSAVAVRVRATDPLTLVPGALLSFTLRMVLSDGQQDYRTFYLLIKQR